MQENPCQLQLRSIRGGPRFAATLTTVLLTVVLLTAPSTTAIVLLAVQTALFGIGAAVGVQQMRPATQTPCAWLSKSFVRPRLGKPTKTEDAAPSCFAEAVSLVFAVVALAGYLSGATLLGAIATGFCLECEVYLLVRRIAPARNENNPTAGTRPATTEISA